MKEFSIHSDIYKLLVENHDSDCLIKSLELTFAGVECRWIEASFANISEEKLCEIRNKFAPTAHEGNGLNQLLISSAFITPTKVCEFITLVHQFEALPSQVFEVLESRGIHLPELTYNPLNSVDKLEKAIEIALKAQEKGCPEKFVELLNYYQENNQIDNCLAVINAIPKNNSFFRQANLQLLDYYNHCEDISIPFLANRFKAAYNAGLTSERELYFSELAGEDCITKLVEFDEAESDVDLLIKLALIIRGKNSTINSQHEEITKLMGESEQASFNPRLFNRHR